MMRLLHCTTAAAALVLIVCAALYVDKNDGSMLTFVRHDTARNSWEEGATRTAQSDPHVERARSGSGDDADFFASSTLPLDDGGLPVDAHEGSILIRDDGSYLWYGTGQRRPPMTHTAVGGGSSSGSSLISSSSSGSSSLSSSGASSSGASSSAGDEWLADSVHLYTSHDLRAWRARGRVFAASSIPSLGGGGPPYGIERVRALYNADRRSYVLLFAVRSALNGSVATVGYASSVSPAGPFKWERAAAPDGVAAIDIAVGSDGGGGGGGAAYLARPLPGARNGTGVSALAGDYLSTKGLCGAAPRVDSPVLFKSGDRWYLLGARRPAKWKPGPLLLYATAPGATPCTTSWLKLKGPAEGPGGARDGFDSAPAFVVPFAAGGGGGALLLVYGGDRWNADGPGSVANASYVWLPMAPRGDGSGGFVLRWYDRWRPADFVPPPSALEM